MQVGVLGGGLQGCCVALEDSPRGESASRWSTRTRTCSPGPPSPTRARCTSATCTPPTRPCARPARWWPEALSFAPFLRRHLGQDVVLATSRPAAYAVHRDSQHGPDAVAGYLAAVHELVADAASAPGAAYLGGDVLAPVRRLSTPEVTEQLDPEHAVAVFDSPEVAIDPVALAAMLRRRIADEPLIEDDVHPGGVGQARRRRAHTRSWAPPMGTSGRRPSTRWSTPCGAGGSRSTRPSGCAPADPGCTGSSTASACGARPAPGAAERDGDLRAVR